MSVSPSRRRFLQVSLGAGLAAPLVAGCTSSTPVASKPDPDEPLRQAAVAAELSLLEMYDAALPAATPVRALVLQAIRDEHAEHLLRLRGPAPTGTAAPAHLRPPPTPAELVAAERAAATSSATAALTASPVLAALLASIAASEASHPVALS